MKEKGILVLKVIAVVFLVWVFVELLVNGFPKGKCSPDFPEYCSPAQKEWF